MRLIKKVLAMSLVTALTFTSIQMPVNATAASVSSTGTEVQVETGDSEAAEQSTQEQEIGNDTVDQTTDVQSTEEQNSAASNEDEQLTEEGGQTTDEQTAKDDEAVTDETVSEAQEMFQTALAGNGTVALSEDLNVDEVVELTLPEGMEEAELTLELNGYTMSSEQAEALFYVAEGVTLSIAGEGSIVNKADNGSVIYNEGTVNLDNADLLATGSKSIGVLNNSTLGEKGLVIKSGTIKAEWFAVGKTAKAEVSKNRPTAFFAAAGIVLSTTTEEIEQGDYSIDENATLTEETADSIAVEGAAKDSDTQETTPETPQETTPEETPTTPSTTDVPAQTDTVDATTVVAPARPLNVTATVSSYNNIKITWSSVTDAKGYIVERMQNGVESTYVEKYNGTATTFSDTDILVGKDYSYRVYAFVNDEENKAVKSEVSVVVTAKTTIAAPTSLTAVQSSATKIALTWKGVTGAAKYNVYQSKNGGAYTLLGSTTSASYTASGLKTKTKYSYKITAVNGTYESDGSNIQSLYAAAAGVTKLKASSSAYNKINLSWKKASGATKYVIYRSTNEATGYKKLKTVTSVKYTDTVKAGVTYYYKVISYSDKAKGGTSAVVSAVTKPEKPTNVKATYKSYNSVTISWSKAGGAGSYAIYRSTSEKSGYTLVGTASKSKKSYTDKTAVAGNKYYYKVCAVANKVESKASKVASVKVKPGAISKLAVSSAGGKSVKLTWSAGKGATVYRIYRSTSSNSGYKKIAETSSLNYTDTGLKNGKTYYYRVYARAKSVNSDYKQTSYVNPKSISLNTTSLNLEGGATAKLTVSFNPSSVSNTTITWSSANTKVATVSKKGVVSAVATGVTTITATAINGVTATCEVGVNQETSGVVIVLDPGHGGSDPGAVSGSLRESALNLKISQYTKAELEKYSGVVVKMTRTGDTYVGLEERTVIAKNYGADMFISQHLNSAASSANGAEVYYSNNSSFKTTSSALGSKILSRLQGVGLNNRGVKTKLSSDGVNDYYSVIRNSVSRGFPGIIVEAAFITGSDDRDILSTEAGLKYIGVATATAIAEYYGLSKK
ncbi:N-acetylmuramoyl-L-alanine amidase [Konateibacter massiliensis]|uniref:N-acetylmuramoyl-L-alanine amidase n=1 Tax=Konateibacter massiliensis TaxID=2002841 RepID=UPI000C16221A|nr:N-acetylmuramoyl-L-alanine amidase [Konateibacter massiliensis]